VLYLIASPAPAAPKIKREVSATSSTITLDNLFDDLSDSTRLKDDVRKGLPVLEKPGSWDSKITNGA